MILEKDIERKVCAQLGAMGILSIKFADPSRRGAPDRICLCPGGQCFFIEFKAPGEKLDRAEQIKYHAKLRNLGFEVFVVDDEHWVGDVFSRLGYCAA